MESSSLGAEPDGVKPGGPDHPHRVRGAGGDAAEILHEAVALGAPRALVGCARIAEGRTGAIAYGASGEGTSSPRCAVTSTERPSSACAAGAPRQTSTRGRTTASSASSQDGRRGSRLVDPPLAARLPLLSAGGGFPELRARRPR
jgi:hypothetical protein